MLHVWYIYQHLSHEYSHEYPGQIRQTRCDLTLWIYIVARRGNLPVKMATTFQGEI